MATLELKDKNDRLIFWAIMGLIFCTGVLVGVAYTLPETEDTP